MDEIQQEEDVKYVIELQHLKKDGTLDTDEYLECQENKWRDTLDYKTLETWLTCDNEELRLHTLELITISKKSTLSFTKQELDLIITFTKCNFREKIEYVPFIKKILKRVNDSYAVIRRQLERGSKLTEAQKIHSEFSMTGDDLLKLQSEVIFYESFVNTIHQICVDNLYPGAVNVRKKSSLQILCLMEEFLSEDLKKSLWNLDKFEKIFECLVLDTYEVNKTMAFQLVTLSKLAELYFDTKEKLYELITVAVQLGNSLRPLDSITAAYMLKIGMFLPNIEEVLFEYIKFKKVEGIQEKIAFYIIMLLKESLEDPVKLATENIVIASSRHSLYGYIFCIRSILSAINLRGIVDDPYWKNIISDLVNMCFELNTAVSQIVNSSSPEGHLPMDLNPRYLNCVSQDTIITPQMVLLCSWRTVKEISLFFGFLTSNAPLFNEISNTGLLTELQIKEIGNKLVTLLCETKHRGAFEQAHVGFGQLCTRLWHLDEKQGHMKQLPKVWLQQLLLTVVGLAPENSKLCATRRSAGVPFMVQALVTSEIKKRMDCSTLTFHSVMRILLKLSNIEDNFSLGDIENILFNETLFADYKKSQHSNHAKLNEITEIKTHALNILRALFRHCLLGELVKDYVAEGFITAFKSYDGKSWAERNAATLLFSSLVVRVFGVQRTKDHVNLTLHNKMTGRNFFERFPSLLPFLLNELAIFVNESENEIKPKIQSILLILSRLYPGASSEAVDYDWKIDQFIDLVSKCGKSRVYKTRELAARALVPLLTEKNVIPISSNLLNQITTHQVSLNLLHGYTLQLLELVKSPQFAKIKLPPEELSKFFSFNATKILHDLESNNNSPACFPVSTGVLEICIELSKLNSYNWIYKDSAFLNLLEKIQTHLTHEKLLKVRPGIELYELATINLLITVLKSSDYNGPLISNEYVATQFWEHVLKHKNIDVLIITWSNFIHIIQKTNSAMSYDLGFMTAIKIFDQPASDPELQEAIFQFIRSAVEEMEKGAEFINYIFANEQEKRYICVSIFKNLSQQLKIETFYPKGEFFKLFGRIFGFLLRNKMASELTTESKKLVYDAFLSQSAMESNIDCRIGVSEVLLDLYIKETNEDNIPFILDWWTTLLNLLFDDNAEVRSNAAQGVCELPPTSKRSCDTIVTNLFFEKFVSTIGQYVDVIAAAFFCWSMTSADVVLEEMDEADVFNKSCNYECFEPLQIANSCASQLQKILPKKAPHSIPLSKHVKEWLRRRLEHDDSRELDTFGDLIAAQAEAIPNTEGLLNKVLDPTYPAKLIKGIAYREMSRAAMSVNGLD